MIFHYPLAPYLKINEEKCNTTSDVKITGLTFSSNRAHHLMIKRIFMAVIFFQGIYCFIFKEREREERESCDMFISLSNKPIEMFK